MIPAFERLVVGIAVVSLHNSSKLPSIDRFEEVSKDAITVSHARPLSESRQPESTRFAPDWSGMLRDIVNHSPDTPAAKEANVYKVWASAKTTQTVLQDPGVNGYLPPFLPGKQWSH